MGLKQKTKRKNNTYTNLIRITLLDKTRPYNA